MTRVSVYNKAGHQRDLGDLRQGRAYHACSMYDGNNGNGKVIINLNKKHYSNHCYQLLIVTGGRDSKPDNDPDSKVDSTEVYQDNAWRMVGKLPVPLSGLRAATIRNRVFAFGRYHFMRIVLYFKF